eukprot:250418_1
MSSFWLLTYAIFCTSLPTLTIQADCTESIIISGLDSRPIYNAFNGEWMAYSLYSGKPTYTKDGLFLYYASQNGAEYFWTIYTSIASGTVDAVWDRGWCYVSDLTTCNNWAFWNDQNVHDTSCSFVCGSGTPKPTPNPTVPTATAHPTTPNPTATANPTTPSPTQPGTIACGAATVGRYSNAPVNHPITAHPSVPPAALPTVRGRKGTRLN